jgi:hypothetical protein
MAGNGLGRIAGRWLKTKVAELTATDERARGNAAFASEELEREARAEAVEEAVFTAAPALREFKERQEAARIARDVREAEEREAELRSLPLADIGVRVSGAIDAEMAVSLPTLVRVDQPHPDDEAADPTSDWYDPYGAQPTLVVRISAFDAERPWLGDHQFNEWAIYVPGYHGDGTYDIGAIHRAREKRNAAPEYIDWYLSIDDAEEDFFFDAYSDAPGTVTVADGGRSIALAMTLAGATGSLTASANIRLA